MNLELDIDDLLCLVKGSVPSAKLIKSGDLREFGIYNPKDLHWGWNILKLRNLNETELLRIYKLCKQSWI